MLNLKRAGSRGKIVTTENSADAQALRKRDRLVIVASSLGTVFEWYDFFLYGILASLLGQLFFPSGNPTAATLASLAAFGAGFGVRPLGAVVFGILGDRVGRKYTFLITISLMGGATAAIGFLPTFADIGLLAPVLLLALRLLQGLALGGEYGGAAIYVAEHAPKGKRGLYTSWIQVAVPGGFLLCLVVVLACRHSMSPDDFNAWGWRIPFLLSLLMLAISLYIRLKLSESPVFQAMKSAGATSRAPLAESFSSWENTRQVLVALFGVAAGLTVIYYTSQFSTLYFLQGTAKIPEETALFYMASGALLAGPLYVGCGWLTDRLGRKPVLLAGYGLTLLLLFPMFHLMADGANPALVEAGKRAPISISAAGCEYQIFAAKQPNDCGKALAWLTKQGVSYTKTTGDTLVLTVGDQRVEGFDADRYAAALVQAGYPDSSDPARRNPWKIVLAVAVMVALSAMTYGQVAAILVELFPARIRYTSISVPYHIGTGYFGGFLPFISQYIVVSTGGAFSGLWYTFGVVLMAFLVSLFFLPETHRREIGHI